MTQRPRRTTNSSAAVLDSVKIGLAKPEGHPVNDDEHRDRNDLRLNASSLLHSSSILVVGGGLGGIVNAIFNLLLIRVSSTSTYSSAGPLLALGTIAASASVGIEYVAVGMITRTNSFAPVLRQLVRLAIPATLALGLTPLASSFLNVSNLEAFLGILLASLTLIAALPTAMLVARGMLFAAVSIALAEAVLRCFALLLAHRVQPVQLALWSSVAVTGGGAALMALYAIMRDRSNAAPREPLDRVGEGQLWKSVLALGLYIPITLPTWLARHSLPNDVAGVITFAAFLGSGVMMFAGPVTSALIPRIQAVADRASVRRGAVLTFGFAVVASLGVIVVGPLVLPSLVASPLPELNRYLIPACLAGIGWSVAAYFTWVRSANGESSRVFIASATAGIVLEVILGSLLDTPTSITWSPLLALLIYSTGFLWPRPTGF